jgi:hydrogenase expression/formation protein HypC
MCLAIPGVLKQISQDGASGLVDYGGVSKRAELMLTPSARVGDAVIVHAGFVITVLDKKEGEELIMLARETGQYD